MTNEEIIVKFIKYAWDLGISVEVGRSQRFGELEMVALRCRTHNAASQLMFIDWFEMAHALKNGMAEKIAQDLCVPAFEVGEVHECF